MEFSESTVVSLISHLHAVTADFTNAKLADKNLVSSHGFILYLLSVNLIDSIFKCFAVNFDLKLDLVLLDVVY